MIRRKNGIITETNLPKTRKVYARSISKGESFKFYPEYIDIFRYEDGHRVSIVMPYKKKVVEQYIAEGWRVAERYKRPVFSLLEGGI